MRALARVYTREAMHTHFGSATFGFAAFLSVIVFGTFWRAGWGTALGSRIPAVRGFAKAALTQY